MMHVAGLIADSTAMVTESELQVVHVVGLTADSTVKQSLNQPTGDPCC